MNDLLDDIPYEKLSSDVPEDIESGPPAPPPNPGYDLERFTASASLVSKLVGDAGEYLKKIDALQGESKKTESVETYQELSKQISKELASVTQLAKDIKSRIDELVADNALNLTYPDCGPGSSIERARSNITSELRDRLQEFVVNFSSEKEDLRDDHFSEFQPEVAKYLKEAEESRQQAVAANPDGFLDIASHMQKRNESMREVNTNLKGLLHMFTEMSVMVDAQGDQIDSIDTQVQATVEHGEEGLAQLQEAKKYHDRSLILKLILFAIASIFIVLILIWILPELIVLIKSL